MEYRDPILSMAKMQPVLPTHVAKKLNVSSIIAAAMLSEMVSKKLLKITHLKVGSSPLYYLPGTEGFIEQFKGNLGEKELRAVELLKEKRVVREAEQDPLTRVCLRQIKDFATPLEVIFNGKKEIFFKWFLFPDDQAREVIGSLLREGEIRGQVESSRVDAIVEKGVVSGERVDRSDRVERSDRPVRADRSDRVDAQVDRGAEVKSRKVPPKREPVAEVARAPEVQKPLLLMDNINDAFLQDCLSFFRSAKIEARSFLIRRKNAEITFEVSIPSPVGDLSYYCVAKNKKKVLDTDLSSAFVTGQLEKLPVLFVSRGEMTKKAKDLVKNLKGLTVTSF